MAVTNDVVTFRLESASGESRTYKINKAVCGRLELNNLIFKNGSKKGSKVYYDLSDSKTKNVNMYMDTSSWLKIVTFLNTIADACNSSGDNHDDVIDEKDFEIINKNGLGGYKVYPQDIENPNGRVRDEKNNMFLDYSI